MNQPKPKTKRKVSPAVFEACRKNGARGGRPSSYPRGLPYDEIARWRFARLHVAVASGCWEWKGSICPQTGYGKFHFRKRCRAAHRTQWILTFGDIPTGLAVLHKCDNRKCVNPNHFFLGTARDNRLDAMQKGRHSPPPILRGEAHGFSRLRSIDIPRIRELHGQGKMNKDIAKLFGVSPDAIGDVIRGKTWKHICAPAA